MHSSTSLGFMFTLGLVATLVGSPILLIGDTKQMALGQISSDTGGKQPNILFIVQDDIGFASLKSYGGDLPMPAIDGLANESYLFTNFHVLPACSPTRGVFMTGVDSHRNGIPTLGEIMTPNQAGKPGYELNLNDRVATVADFLKQGGYHTYTTGKWHVGHDKGSLPADRGFEESLQYITGFPGYSGKIEGAGKLFTPTWVKNNDTFEYPYGTPVSTLITDELINMIKTNKEDGKPFFAYLAYNANHFPLQSSQELIKKNDARYDMGWDEVREQRLENMKKLGIVSQNVTLSPRESGVPAWDELNATEKAYESKKMEVYAAMAEEMDIQIGKLFDYLKQTGQYDNTMIIFTTDNGPEGTAIEKETAGTPEFEAEVKGIQATNNNSEANLGNPNSYFGYGPGWAQVSATPLFGFKYLLHEAGTRVPLLIKVPDGSEHKKVDSLIMAGDLVPTIMDIAGVSTPDTFNGKQLEKPAGKSITLLQTSRKIHNDTEMIPVEFFGSKAVYNGNLKGINIQEPIGDGKWHLYDIVKDPTEAKDLATEMPELLNQMAAVYDTYANETRVIPPDFVAFQLPEQLTDIDQRHLEALASMELQ
ncbi:MAG TPA: arylsulfatase [Nitrososphaeraceae archaeon]|nr:arylsulfatase [Nitrososphaeraceae archaeon]